MFFDALIDYLIIGIMERLQYYTGDKYQLLGSKFTLYVYIPVVHSLNNVVPLLRCPLERLRATIMG